MKTLNVVYEDFKFTLCVDNEPLMTGDKEQAIRAIGLLGRMCLDVQ